MKEYQTITFSIENKIGTICLNRPEIHNAFNEVMIADILHCFGEIEQMDYQTLRVVLLKGKGKSFCAGADLNWMKGVANYSYQENYQESFNLSQCFNAIYACKFPTVALVHGAAIGGANGLLAACDFVLAHKQTVFSLSEVKIGIVPACISPYVVKRVGEYKSKELMLTGMRFRGKEAQKAGLVNWSGGEKKLDAKLVDLISKLKTSGPIAVSTCKQLLYDVKNVWNHEQAMENTARMIAELRQSAEGQEGMNSFLEKRKPNWVDKMD
ncbi:enoyl-CoA hydratase-related protein [Ancylomarina longa]|uniref:Enoyl-CoA hydratase/isomerase family protein n=1 Tax=Ancylomarina longa TaxID=2487017 RepID=A0A434AZ68_9BACT|nr:enoyl-CoA hydratase-related protein [Ancylomarina longa]RUT79918.1 enoyl-CoA hydratase/isomerase family protein [Ancylomarina longa]